MNPILIGKKQCGVCDSTVIHVRLSFDTHDKNVRIIFYFCTVQHLQKSMETIDWIRRISNALDSEITV